VHRRYARAGPKPADIDAVEIKRVEILDNEILVTVLNSLAGRTLAVYRVHFRCRKVALREDGQHGFADGAGRADDSDVE
jgi:hypothetical protein